MTQESAHAKKPKKETVMVDWNNRVFLVALGGALTGQALSGIDVHTSLDIPGFVTGHFSNVFDGCLLAAFASKNHVMPASTLKGETLETRPLVSAFAGFNLMLVWEYLIAPILVNSPPDPTDVKLYAASALVYALLAKIKERREHARQNENANSPERP